MEKQGMASVNNRKSRMKDGGDNRFNNNMSGYGETSGGRGGGDNGQPFDMAFYAKHMALIVKF